ncbi:aromatic acid exporter family protein [Gemelliphila palaticanis]|uniref:Aromatic acid exporter family protein n=1 Tax=Gemelliphila palaticanis TaxID=81950 RepID=A0ABX2T3F1_9BACL|nr:aromatic acid exporter family protein [Gemella palaticanis]MBF0716218.1 aromatic acid exporter family protein [Gemella palaticanis]NYS48148.1 aromatic acid exporter family protein [Gemella palaticanis]
MDYLKIIKMLSGSIIAIIIAKYLGLNNEFSAGLITLLSITDTKKRTYRLAMQRIISLILGFIIGIFIFYIFGYNLISFTIILLIFIPLSMVFNVMMGLVPSLVLLGHIMSQENITKSIIINEFFLLIIAVVVGGVINLYMPSKENEIQEEKKQLEYNIKEIFYIFYLKMTPSNNRNIIEEKIPKDNIDDILIKINKNILQLDKLVNIENENILFGRYDYNKKYVLARNRQYNVLSYMVESLKLLKVDRDQGVHLAALFYLTAEQVSEYNSCSYLLSDIDTLFDKFKKDSLPKTREEFEDRAILYKLLTDFKRFLEIKYEFIESIK